MPTPDERISVVIPAFNRGASIERAIRSALRQTLPPLEVLVVDDCSEDDTCRLVQSMAAEDARVRLIRRDRNGGGAAARNSGIVAAKGELVAFLDSDDEWTEHHLERKAALLRDDPQPSLVFGSFYVSDGTRTRTQRCLPPEGDPLEYVFFGRGDMRSSTFVARRADLLRVRFDDDLRKHQDWDLVINVMQRFNVAVDSQATAILHVSATNRLSGRPDREASSRFYRKNRPHGSRTGWILFCTMLLESTFRFERRSADFRYHMEVLQSIDRRARAVVGPLSVLLYLPRIGGRLFKAGCRAYSRATAVARGFRPSYHP